MTTFPKRFDRDVHLDALYLGSQLGAHVVVAWFLGRHPFHRDIAHLFQRLRADAIARERAP